MKMTLLKMVQKVLNSTSGDEVSSISDTVEAMQIANIIEDVFYNMVTNKCIPELEELLEVEGVADSTKPNYLKLPAAVANIRLLRYRISNDVTDTEVQYRDMVYIEPSVFLDRVCNRPIDAFSQVVTDYSGVQMVITNNKMPSFWTSFDDATMVFDSFDNTVDTTLQQQKTMAIGTRNPTFTLTDAFIPDMDDNLFPILLNEAKSWAYIELKQQPHPKAEQQSRKQRIAYQDDRSRFQKHDTGPNYGRR